MPNWTYCKLKAPKDVLEKYINNDNEFDFNLVIPQPEILSDPELTAGGDTDWCVYWYLSNQGQVPLGIIMRNYQRYFSNFSTFMFFTDETAYADKMFKICRSNPEEYYRKGKKYIQAFKECGYTNWYDWRLENWGTKWNACECKISPDMNRIEFETAWCPPVEVIEKIFQDNPGRIEFYWTNEDYDGNHHLIRRKSGKLDMLGCEGIFDADELNI